MKFNLKKMILIFSLLLLLTACGEEKDVNKSDGKNDEKKTNTQVENNKGDKKDNKKDSEVDNSEEEKENKEAVYNNIKFEDAFNKDQYVGFTEGQIAELNENGFLVLNQNPNFISNTYHEDYHMANYHSHPVYITPDAVLNAFNIFYKGSMMEFEFKELYFKEAELAIDVTNKLLEEYFMSDDEEITLPIQHALAYMYNGTRLYFNEIDKVDESKLFNTEILEKRDKLYLKFKDLDKKMPNEIVALADTDFDRYLFDDGIEGYYAENSLLRNYYMANEWFSNYGLDLDGDKHVKKSAFLLASVILSDEKLREDWEKINKITSYYSSEYDDIGIYELEPIINGVLHFNELGYAGLADEQMMKTVDKEIEKLECSSSDKKEFKFMGQRYSIDKFVFDNLSDPASKPFVSAFEFLDVLCAKKADEFIDTDEYSSAWKDYSDRVGKMKRMHNDISTVLLRGDLYHNYISAIQIAVSKKVDLTNKNIPDFMKNDSYEYIKLNTGLGAFAQLKNNYVSDYKYMVADIGALEEKLSPHYIEPNVALYELLSNMMDETIKNLQDFGVEEKDLNYANRFSDLLKVFVRVSEQELKGEKISDDDLRELGNFGNICKFMRDDYANCAMGSGFELDCHQYLSAPVISDISSNSSKYLELGIGVPLDIYVLTRQNGKDIIAKGTIFSSYEFYYDDVIDNSSWLNMLGEVNDYGNLTNLNENMQVQNIMSLAEMFVNKEKNNVEIREFKW